MYVSSETQAATNNYLLEELESPWAPVILLPLHNA